MGTLKIDNREVTVDDGTTILQAARKLNLTIPTLCHHEDLCMAGNCRVCVVEQKGVHALIPACSTPVLSGMEIFTHSNRVRQARRCIIALLLSEHSSDCTRCYKNNKCELQTLAREYGIDASTYINLTEESVVDRTSPAIQKDNSKCIRCGRCIRTCAQLQHIAALTMAHRGPHTRVETFFNKPLADVACSNCGQCVNRCPTGALSERLSIEDVWNALNDPDKFVVVQTAPSVRVALGECLGGSPGQIVTGKLVTALRYLGFDAVFDTNFAADLTVIEEAAELLARLKIALKDNNKAALPMTTSCSAGWVKFIEHEYPNLLDNLSTCKSPQQMFGAIAKTYYARKQGIDPQNMVVVSIMPCTAKKFEAERPEMISSGLQDVDFVLTTRELGLMIEQAGINFANLPEQKYDNPLGVSTGAGVIFGATGGVMEAALRTAYETVTGRPVPFANLDITPVRGMEGVREASIRIEGCKPEWDFLEGVVLNVAVAHGLANAKKIIDQVKAGTSKYHFIEIMACPGGCIGGGGQPVPTSQAVRSQRLQAIYQEDKNAPLRKSHENPYVKALYEEFLKEPLGERSHRLLHTHYTRRKRY